MITATTRTFALLGDPVHHSLSPVMQNAAFRAAGEDAVYVAIRCAPGQVGALIPALTLAGGGGNVTIPHKQLAAQAVDAPTANVVATGACNTFWLSEGRIMGDNTDVDGFATVAQEMLGSLRGLRALVIGAGGAASAAAWALLRDGAGPIFVAGRSDARVSRLIDRLDESGRTVRPIRMESIRDESFDLVVNATPLGLHEQDPLPLAAEQLDRVRALVDMVYRDDTTPLVRLAAAKGVTAIDGRAMLLAQGALSFECWYRRPAPIDAMREALARTRSAGQIAAPTQEERPGR